MDAQRPETAAEAWRELSRRYVQDVSRYFRERTVGEVARFLFQGGGRYGNCPLHDQFLAQAQEQVDLFVSGNPAASEAGTPAGGHPSGPPSRCGPPGWPVPDCRGGVGPAFDPLGGNRRFDRRGRPV